jgi:CHAD domain-containing protein
VLLRQRHERHRLALMRALIKEFERIEMDRLIESVQHGVIRAMRHTAAGWDRRLRRAIAERAAGAAEAIVHATGVYFPKRAHKARIAIKKFRYATEIAAATGLWNARETIRELKKGQDLLGRVHDRQELLDRLRANDDSYPEGTDREQIELAAQVVEAEAHELHARYLARREGLLDAARAAERAVSQSRLPLWPAAGLAASSTLMLVRLRIGRRASNRQRSAA